MIQHEDKSFGAIKDLSEVLEDATMMCKVGVNFRAVFCGTEDELKQIKEEAPLADRLKMLEDKVELLAPISTSLHLPNNDEVRKFGNV